MELYLNATSPYARVARIVILEKGLARSTPSAYRLACASCPG